MNSCHVLPISQKKEGHSASKQNAGRDMEQIDQNMGSPGKHGTIGNPKLELFGRVCSISNNRLVTKLLTKRFVRFVISVLCNYIAEHASKD